MADIKNERCVLCLDEKRSPVRIQCGHSFCFECLDVYKSYQKYAWANKCPICRSILKEKKRAVKRKLTYSNATTDHNPRTRATAPALAPVTAPAPATSNAGSSSSAILNAHQAEQVLILEEFMAIAAGYDHNDHNELNSSGEQNTLVDNDAEYIDDSQDEEVTGDFTNDNVDVDNDIDYYVDDDDDDGDEYNDEDDADNDDDYYDENNDNDYFYTDSEDDTYYFSELDFSHEQPSSYDYDHEIGDDSSEISAPLLNNNNPIFSANRSNYNNSSRINNNPAASSRQAPDTEVVVLDDVIIVD